MIEALIEDKKKLYEKTGEFKTKLNDSEEQKKKLQKVYEERLQVELKKNKDAWIASEKVRKERWQEEKIKEIRTQTVKGLEPEI